MWKTFILYAFIRLTALIYTHTHTHVKMSKLGPIRHFLSPVSCDSLVLQGLRCEWGAGVLKLVLSLALSHTGH